MSGRRNRRRNRRRTVAVCRAFLAAPTNDPIEGLALNTCLAERLRIPITGPEKFVPNVTEPRALANNTAHQACIQGVVHMYIAAQLVACPGRKKYVRGGSDEGKQKVVDCIFESCVVVQPSQLNASYDCACMGRHGAKIAEKNIPRFQHRRSTQSTY